MKMCPNCHNQITDEAVYCPVCGSVISVTGQYQPEQQYQMPYNAAYTQQVPSTAEPEIDLYDHAADFSTSDISENKVIAMLMYLLGPLGILIALLAAKSSGYIDFHVRQAMKLTVMDILSVLTLCILNVLMFLIGLQVIIILLTTLVFLALLAIHLICFFWTCKNQAKEPYFVRKLTFLK